MKNIFITAICLTAFGVYGQQLSLNSQYMFNEAYLNPAAAGSKPYIPIHLNLRRQWIGFDGGPTTQSITTHANLGKNLGFGGNLYNDVTGPSRTTGINTMLSYRLRLSKNDKHSLRMGIGLSLSQHLIDVTQLTTEIDEDPSIAGAYNNQLVPDADIGVFYSFAEKGFAGISVKNAFQVKRDLFNSSLIMQNMLVRHYYIMGGYDFELNQDWSIKPTGLIRMIEAGPLQFDVNAIIIYKKVLWMGGGYRHKDAISALAGCQLGIVKIGYAYDFTTSEIRNYSSGSHELFLELQLGSKKKNSGNSIPYLKRNRVYSPSI